MSSAPASSAPPAILLMGPTAAGKTALAMELVERYPCDIISVDSTMVYRGLDIGSAKPDAAELARAPHRLIDICDPADAYSAARFRSDALREMAAISAAGRIPLLVGGTFLYFRALVHGLSPLPAADPVVRAELEQAAAERGWPALHAELAALDAESAARIHPHDAQRIQRALEVQRVTGFTRSELFRQEVVQPFLYRPVKLVVSASDRGLLHRRIEQRFGLMLEQGLVDETRRLYNRGDLDTGMPAVRAVGYRQIWEYLAGRMEHDEMAHRAIIATRQLARRQLTWLRKEPDCRWFETTASDLADQVTQHLGTNAGLYQ